MPEYATFMRTSCGFSTFGIGTVTSVSLASFAEYWRASMMSCFIDYALSGHHSFYLDTARLLSNTSNICQEPVIITNALMGLSAYKINWQEVRDLSQISLCIQMK